MLACACSHALMSRACARCVHLGYAHSRRSRAELPFLHRCECFVYPIALIGIGFVLSLPFKFNPTAVVAYI